VYAGHDGNVYRNQGGSWQKYDNGSWNSVDRPVGTSGQLGAGDRAQDRGLSSSTVDQLNRDRAARSDGAQRTRDLGSVKSGGGSTRTWSGAGSYRPRSGGFGGGGFRGGGMRGGRR
jgi:hypothetical protein